MRAEGVLRDRSQPRTWPRKRTLSGCKMKGNLDNVVLIDVDSDSLDNVIIIDVPESLQQKLRGPSVLRKGKKIQFGGIINIDDDEINNMEYPEVGVEVGVDLDSDTSSSKSYPASDYVHESVNLGDDECRVVRENNSAFRLSKCKRPYPGKDACRNRYGLNPESESSSSDIDCSDCELMEGSFGKLHEEWEKASLKRKSNFCKGKSGLEDRGSPSCLNNDIRPNFDVGVEERTDQHSENAFCCNSSNANYKKQSFVSMEDGDLGTASLSPEMRNSFVESDQKVDQESSPWFKPGLVEKVQSSRKKADFLFRGETFTEEPSSSTSQWQSYKHVNDRGGNFCDKEQGFHGPSFGCNQEQDAKQHHNRRTSFMNKPKNFMGEQFKPKGIYRFFHHTKAALDDEEASLRKSGQSGGTHTNNETAVPTNKCEEFSQTTSSCSASLEKSHHTRTEFMEKGKPNTKEPLVSNYRSSSETGAECGVAHSEHNIVDVFDESFLCKTSSPGIPDVCNEKAVQLDMEKPDSKGVSMCNSECVKTNIKQGNLCSEEVKGDVIGSTSDGQLCNGRNTFHAQSFTITAAVPNDIINEREKLKETDEYKQAMEQEWASRQQQLQIQKEEAQRLRKKKRAESMRLLDMERRQKQRLEEIRETQKKDEENMNLKEQIRVEVRRELHKLETICTDMASLLRALGIHVGGSFHPLSHEVHAAYKRALLKFHPDRASKTDIRQEVEAEEKFKLISRMKEKFLLTSCH